MVLRGEEGSAPRPAGDTATNSAQDTSLWHGHVAHLILSQNTHKGGTQEAKS